MRENVPIQFCFYTLVLALALLSRPQRIPKLERATPAILFTLAVVVIVMAPLGATLFNWPIEPTPFITLSFLFAIWGRQAKGLPA